MGKLSIVLGLSLLLFVTESIACTCAGSKPFLSIYNRAKLIGLVKVLRHSSNQSIEAEILEIYKGEEVRKTITIWGDNGVLCRPYVSQFKDGQQYVMALYSGDSSSGNRDEKESDYFISICGEYWLTVNADKTIAKGRIRNGKKSIKLAKLKTLINGG